MEGLMQDWPLLVWKCLDHARANFPETEIVSRSIEGPIVRSNYAEVHANAKRCAKALARLGVKPGDRVATMAWNTGRHLEAWYGIIGCGAITHTVNPRLFPEQIQYIMNHAEDIHVFVDLTFLPIIEKLKSSLPSLRKVIVLTDAAHMPKDSPIAADLVCYADFIADSDEDFDWVVVDENAACGMCYTSGTTGNPKGVLYSHRANVLHTLIAAQPCVMSVDSRETILPVVPMFHANSWGLTYTAPMTGAKLVMPGMKMDGASIYELLDTEKVTFSAAVPTVWLMLLQELEKTGAKLPHLQRVVIGGSACPRAVMEAFETTYDVRILHAWGMTEMSPLGTVGSLKAAVGDFDFKKRIDLQLKQGHAPFGVEMKITNDEGEELPRDGKAFGHLLVRGPAVAKAYFKNEGARRDDGTILEDDGFFDTGDVATIDEHGYMQITDRSKDVIKSGGEWISSIELENEAVGCPGVAEAAVIGVYHPKWDERPLLVIVKKPGAEVARDDVLGHLEGRIAKWWMPDDVVFVDEIPHTATGKIQKTALREQFSDYKLPTIEAAE